MICSYLDCSRQGYYKHLKTADMRQQLEERVVTEVRKIRQSQPRAGGLKLKRMLSENSDLRLRIGRDHLFTLLRERHLLVRTRRKYKGCTDFRHKLPIYPNLLEHISITGINQVWVSDITYLRTYGGFVYLYLITDYYSRKILGYHVSHDLKAESAVTALRKAFRKVPSPVGLIHHSDHGIQYCSEAYQSLLQEYQVSPSMTGKSRCYDNAVAGRVNGILKDEFGLGRTMSDIKTAVEAVRDAVSIYNRERLHRSLNYRTPEHVYRTWKPAEATQQQSVLQGVASAQ